MKWNEVLSTLDSLGEFSDIELKAIAELPSIRDEVFFPEYNKYGFVPIAYGHNDLKSYYESGLKDNLISTCGIGLISMSANRELWLSFAFLHDQEITKGFISDNISLIFRGKELNGLATMDILLQKRAGLTKNVDYNRLYNYPGTLQERFKACLLQIKHNYDSYVEDIISGEYWDEHALDTSYR